MWAKMYIFKKLNYLKLMLIYLYVKGSHGVIVISALIYEYCFFFQPLIFGVRKTFKVTNTRTNIRYAEIKILKRCHS